MSKLDDSLLADLQQLDESGLRRHLKQIDGVEGNNVTVQGRKLRNFSSNDYLGLSQHPSVVEAACRATRDWGAGSRASRLVCGSSQVHHHLEEALAQWKQTEAALTFSSGYATALGTLPALAGVGDVIIVDRLVHACCLDGARLSGATLRVFRHNDVAHLESILQRLTRRREAQPRRIWIVAESVYSMDGDLAPLPELVELKERYGACLFLDEAHAVGLFGEGRSGRAEAEGLLGRIEVQLGTLGKALGAAGGYVCGSRILVDYLVNRARAFIFSTAPVPAAAAAALAALQLIQSVEGSERCQRTWGLARRLNPAVNGGKPGDVANLAAPSSAILPLIVGESEAALDLAHRLQDRGIFVPAIRYPTVPRGGARLRFTVCANQTPDDVEHLIQALALEL